MQMNIYTEGHWGNELMDYPEVREAVAHARVLFPELQLWDIEPIIRDHVERFNQTLEFECLNKFVVVAEKHLDHKCRVWSWHSGEERPRSVRDSQRKPSPVQTNPTP